MQLIKLGIISLVVLFGIVTAISLLLPSEVIVSRPIDLQVSPDSVQAYLSNLENWEKWLDHSDTVHFSIDKKAGKVNFQNTHITLVSSQPGKILTQWQVGHGAKMAGDFRFIKHPNNPLFTLQWQFTQHIKWYPWEKFASILSDKALGPYMERSLTKLKEQVEPKMSN